MKFTTIDDILAHNSINFSNNIAFKSADQDISYLQLENSSKRLCLFLRNLNLVDNVPVAIFMEKSIPFVISIFGILKNGSIFVPLNSQDNSSRIINILDDINAPFIITNDSNLSKVINYAQNKDIKIIVLTNTPPTDSSNHVYYFNLNDQTDNISNLIKTHTSDHLAYIIYTSGSTGKPKGVSIRHKSVLNFIEETVKMFRFDQQTRIVSLKPFHFDASLTDILCPLFSGGTTIIDENAAILPRILKKIILSNKISHLSLTPIVLKLLVDFSSLTESDFSFLKTISFGGESVPTDYVVKLKKQIPHVRFFNRYGPTETTVVTSAYEVKDDLSVQDLIPIGKPIKNVNFYVLNNDLKPVNPGSIGELYIGGIQVMEGYWNDQLLTENVLLRNIVSNDILYKTGDMVSQDEDGNYVFRGRIDDIIKKFGYRISLSEVEFAIKKMEVVNDCICLFDNDGDTPKIIAVISANSNLPAKVIREELHKYLPTYMIPDIVFSIETIPYTHSGKPDRNNIKQLYKTDALKKWV